ncbi:helix-turn-helix transcriptional regulator [Kiloniella laminariae]|uniref:Helix-turn-helix transcriptional regulator n=1 Tax=Kiloniella laminariae TaxID=454162 RepID=A0ABT4LPW1_9PROT|nr:helix-turn-helix transcriptional regulator [Kiloniella laminariae]MCZ4283143.1 helix-turn-helix transcriptional regulator [Kiloniella laminariae]
MENIHRGSSFDDFLAEDGILEEVTELAAKRVIALSVARSMAEQKISKAELARRMNTSPNQVYRVLNETDTGISLHTIMQAAKATGSRVRITIE